MLTLPQPFFIAPIPRWAQRRAVRLVRDARATDRLPGHVARTIEAAIERDREIDLLYTDGAGDA